jgi:hypothetical protein
MFGSETVRKVEWPMRGPGNPPGRTWVRREHGAALAVALLGMLVLSVLGLSFLGLGITESTIAGNQRSAADTFYVAEAGILEALQRMRLDETTNSDELDSTIGDPAMVEEKALLAYRQPTPDPTVLGGLAPYWHYDAAWSCPDCTGASHGNYIGGAGPAALDTAGRTFTTAKVAAGEGYTATVTVVPVVKKSAGAWSFVDHKGDPAGLWRYRKIISVARDGDGREVRRIVAFVRKYLPGNAIPASVTAAGPVTLGGASRVENSDTLDPNPPNTAVQAGGSITVGTGIVVGEQRPDTTFPGFEAIFGMTKDQLRANATTVLDLTSDATNPIPTQGKDGLGNTLDAPPRVVWINARSGGSVYTVTFDSDWRAGTREHPVILVLDGNLTLDLAAVYGVVYVTGIFRLQQTSSVRGAVIAESSTETAIISGSGKGAKVYYDYKSLANITKYFFPYLTAPVSWQEI